MRKRFGSGTVQLSRIISALFFLGGLTLLSGMVWQVGLTGLMASCVQQRCLPLKRHPSVAHAPRLRDHARRRGNRACCPPP